MILGSHMILIHAWCEMSMMKFHEHQACENWIHLLKCTPHTKHEHCSAKMNSNNWRLVFFLKPTIELLLQVRGNQAMPGSHCFHCTLKNIMSTKYISWKYITTSYKCTSIRYLIKESWKCLYIQVSRSPSRTGVAHWQFHCYEVTCCKLEVMRSISPDFTYVPCLTAGVGHLGL